MANTAQPSEKPNAEVGTVDLKCEAAADAAVSKTGATVQQEDAGTVDLSGATPSIREEEEKGRTVDHSQITDSVERTLPYAGPVEQSDGGITVELFRAEGVHPAPVPDATISLAPSGVDSCAAEPNRDTIDTPHAVTVELSGTRTIDSDATSEARGEPESRTEVLDQTTSATATSVSSSQPTPVSSNRPSPAQAKQVAPRRPLHPETPARDARHSITRFLAEGGLGKVFVAQDIELNREVVLKTLKPETAKNADARRRFVREAQVNAQLEHPNIIPIYQGGKNPEDGQPYYTMKFIRGRELADLIAQYHKHRRAGTSDPVELRRLLTLFVNACYAISYANHRRVVHRDLKPANITVGEFGELIVLDWGLAKILDETETSDAQEAEAPNSPRRVGISADADTGLTVKGRIMGTPAYMAPEQAAGKTAEIGPAADIYALGGILFEILTGEPPHKLIHKYEPDKLERWTRRDSTLSRKRTVSTSSGTQLKENTMDLLGRIIAGALPAPRDIEPSVPPALQAICGKAMKLHIQERYANASEIAEDVQRWLADEPVSVHRDTLPERLARWMRKNRFKVQVGFASLVLILTVSVLAGVLINNARESEKQQKENVAGLLKESRKQIDRLMNDVISVTTNFPNFEDQAINLLRGRVGEYERLRDQIANQLLAQGDSPLLRAELGRLHIQLGFIHSQFRDLEAAVRSYRAAEQVWAELHDAAPNEANYSINLATALNNLADISYEQGAGADQVVPLFDRAIQILEATHGADAVQQIEAQETLAQIQADVAEKLIKMGEVDRGRSSLAAAIESFRALATRQPEQLRLVLRLVKAENRHMVLLTDQGKHDEAIRYYESTIREAEDGIRNHPSFQEHRQDALEVLASNAIDRGRALRPLGYDALALESYRSGIRHFQELTKASFNSPNYLNNLAIGHMNEAQLNQELGDTRAAREALTQSVQLAQNAFNYWPSLDYLRVQASSLSSLGNVLSDLGEDAAAAGSYRAAIATYTDEMIATLPPDDGRTRTYQRLRAISRGGLAKVLRKLDERDQSGPEIDLAIREWEVLLQGESQSPNLYAGLAALYINRGDLWYDQAGSQAQMDYRKAITLLDHAAQQFPDSLEIKIQTAQLLSSCTAVDLRDAEQSIKVAQYVVERAPASARYRSTLALAYFRAGRWDDCLQAADTATKIREPIEDSWDHFLRAMAYVGRNGDGDLERAKSEYGRGNKLFADCRPGNLEYRRLQHEAEELLAGQPRNNESDRPQ